MIRLGNVGVSDINVVREICRAFGMYRKDSFCLPLDEALAFRAVFVIASGLDGWTEGNAFGGS